MEYVAHITGSVECGLDFCPLERGNTHSNAKLSYLTIRMNLLVRQFHKDLKHGHIKHKRNVKKITEIVATLRGNWSNMKIDELELLSQVQGHSMLLCYYYVIFSSLIPYITT